MFVATIQRVLWIEMSIVGTVIIIGWLVTQDKSCKVEASTQMHVFVHLRLLKCSPIRPIK